MPPDELPLRLGYLHVGPAQHGVRRYGELLASEARRRDGQSVLEIGLEPAVLSSAALRDAGARLDVADVVHVQYNLQHAKSVWGAGRLQVERLRTFLAARRGPIVATLHDVIPGRGLGRVIQALGPPAAALRTLRDSASALIACSRVEADRVGGAVQVIPHFVEERTLPADREAARRGRAGSDEVLVTVLGIIHRRKGYDLVVEALWRLPGPVRVLFAGRPATGGERYVERLRARARRLGVAERIEVTGYLDEPDLEDVLVATDLAVCPFRSMSASGSLSTWISAARPILAADLPTIRAYDDLGPGAIRTFPPGDPVALADAITSLLPGLGPGADPGVARLRERLAMRHIFDEHVRVYGAVAGIAAP